MPPQPAPQHHGIPPQLDSMHELLRGAGFVSVDLNVKEPKFQGDKLIQDQVLDILEKVVQFAAPDPESLKKKADEDFDFEPEEDEDEDEGEKKDEL